jgi:hypothetical protein
MIKQRGSSWWMVVYARRDPLTGKKVQKTGAAPTKKAAKQLEAKLIRDAGKTLGNRKSSGSHTVGELLDAWHEWRPRKGGISERQLMNYRAIIDNKLAPALGKTKLSQVDTAVIDRLLSQLTRVRAEARSIARALPVIAGPSLSSAVARKDRADDM